MDRSATCLFGIRNYGVDINGFVRHPTRGLCIWLQQRSETKQTWPGKWDNMVGGGLSIGYGIQETAVKEAAEEASIPDHLVKNLVSTGCVSFMYESERGVFPNTEFVYDLELPEDFIPTNSDGEVQAFELLSAAECIEKLFAPDFKTTSCPVVIDFLIRHGVITPENGTLSNRYQKCDHFTRFHFQSIISRVFIFSETNFAEVVQLLHVPLQTLYTNHSSKEHCNSNANIGNGHKNNV